MNLLYPAWYVSSDLSGVGHCLGRPRFPALLSVRIRAAPSGRQPSWLAFCSAHGSRIWLGWFLPITVEPLLFADLLFFATAPGAIWWLARKAPKSKHDCAGRAGIVDVGLDHARRAVYCRRCVLLIGTLYINKQGTLCVSARQTSDFAPQLAIAQSVALGHNFPTEFPKVRQRSQLSFFLFSGR